MHFIDTLLSMLTLALTAQAGLVFRRDVEAEAPVAVEVEAEAEAEGYWPPPIGSGAEEGGHWRPYGAPATVTIVNRWHRPVSTSHVHNEVAPTPLGGEKTPGLMQPSQTDYLVVPTAWAGNVAIVDHQYQPSGDDTLIEGSFIHPGEGWAEAIIDIDVSLVNGFSLPAVCKCNRKKFLSGCGVNLWSEQVCPDNTDSGACKNPARWDLELKLREAPPWFKSCEGKAYTFPTDDGANSFGECQRGSILCCIGEERACQWEWN